MPLNMCEHYLGGGGVLRLRTADIYSHIGGCKETEAPAPFEGALGEIYGDQILQFFLQAQNAMKRMKYQL